MADPQNLELIYTKIDKLMERMNKAETTQSVMAEHCKQCDAIFAGINANLAKLVKLLEGNGKKGMIIAVHDNTQDIRFIKKISWTSFVVALGAVSAPLCKWIFAKFSGG